MKDRKEKIIIALLICNLLVVLGVYRKIHKTLNEMESNTNYSRTYISRIEEGIGNIKYEFREGNKQISKQEYSIKEVNLKEKLAIIEVQVDLKWIEANSKIFVEFENTRNNKVELIPMVNKSELEFNLEKEISIKENYRYKIIQKDEEGNVKKLNSEDLYLNISQKFYEGRIYLSGYQDSQNNYVRVRYNFEIYHFNVEEFKLDKAILEISLDGKSLDSIDVTDRLVEDNIDIQEEGTYYEFEYVVKYEEYKKALDKAKLPVDELQFKLKVICRDGESTTE